MAAKNQDPTIGRAPVRVLIVDDHSVILWGLVKLIEAQRPRLEVVGTASDGQEALAKAASERPDVVILDLELGRESGLDILPPLLETDGGPRVIVLTGAEDEQLHDQAMRLGASGIVLKSEPAQNIIKAVEKVLRGELWLDRATSARMFASFSGRGGRGDGSPDGDVFASLTPREREIVELVAQGLKNEQIAAGLNPIVSEKTIRNNLTAIYDKVGVKSRLELVLLAQRHGLVKK